MEALPIDCPMARGVWALEDEQIVEHMTDHTRIAHGRGKVGHCCGRGEDVVKKIRVFLWSLVKNTLPTYYSPHHRNMATTDVSILFGEAGSWRHSLIDCPMAKGVWAREDE